MIAKMIKLECITNMHVGNGEVNYNIIDNEVERDPITGYPTINSSGVKGALREYFSKEKNLADYVDELFGGNNTDQKTTSPGKLKILGADLIAIPVRASKGDKAYYLVTTAEMMRKYAENCAIFLNQNMAYKETDITGVAAEGIELRKTVTLFGHNVFLMGEDDFKKISLPVMARNKLDNGISQNLWYEEVVPHESIFCFTVLADDDAVMEKFIEGVSGKIIQFGGNASIGYGLCKVEVLGA